MISRKYCGSTVLWFFLVCLSLCVHSDVLEQSVLTVPNALGNEIEVTDADVEQILIPKPVLLKRSSFVGADVVSGAKNLGSRIDTSLDIVRAKIPFAIAGVEADIAIANRDRVILALANFLGMVFGVMKTTGLATSWDDVSDGNKIQVFAQLLYGYGYWGPFALEYENSRVDCGELDFEATLNEYGYVTDHHGYNSLDPILANYYIAELNSKIKENLYCLSSRSSSNQAANELDAYIDVYTQLLSEKLGN